MRLEDQPTAAREALAERVADLRHDLGKYICFETRFLGPDATDEALRAALRADLLATRRRGAEVETAAALWARLRPAELHGDPDVVAIDDAIRALAVLDLRAEAPALDRAGLDRAAALARQIADATRRLDARARALA